MIARWLKELQQLDEQRARLQAQKDRCGVSGYLERQARQQQQLAAAEARLAELSRQLASAEAELLALKQQRQGLQAQQPGPLDRARVSRELEEVQQRHDGLENALLEAMLEQEQLQPQLPQLRAELAETETELEQAWIEERERLDALDTRLRDLDASRQQLLDHLGPEWSSRYAESRQKHPQPLAEGRGGRCGRCRMGISEHEMRLLRNGQAVVCSTCRSLLLASLAE